MQLIVSEERWIWCVNSFIRRRRLTICWVWRTWERCLMTSASRLRGSPRRYWRTSSTTCCLSSARYVYQPHTSYSSLATGLHLIFVIMVQCSSQVGKRAGCKRNWAQSSARTTKIRAQFSAQTTQNRAQFKVWMTKSLLYVNDQNSLTIQHANETRSGHNFVGDRWKHGHKFVYIGCLKNHNSKIFFKFGQGACKSGKAQASTGRALRPQKYA